MKSSSQTYKAYVINYYDLPMEWTDFTINKNNNLVNVSEIVGKTNFLQIGFNTMFKKEPTDDRNSLYSYKYDSNGNIIEYKDKLGNWWNREMFGTECPYDMPQTINITLKYENKEPIITIDYANQPKKVNLISCHRYYIVIVSDGKVKLKYDIGRFMVGIQTTYFLGKKHNIANVVHMTNDNKYDIETGGLF